MSIVKVVDKIYCIFDDYKVLVYRVYIRILIV